MLLSLPARGVWVEITPYTGTSWTASSHSPRGECGLKSCVPIKSILHTHRHSPRGECGLKYRSGEKADWKLRQSLPARGVWVEMAHFVGERLPDSVTPREGSVGWNHVSLSIELNLYSSLPARGVWVEIWPVHKRKGYRKVTPREGSVGWNRLLSISWMRFGVTPREGSVGWNRRKY